MGSFMVFVLGHIDYYPKYGFITDAENLGFAPTHPIPEEVKEAWMVQAISDEVAGSDQSADILRLTEDVASTVTGFLSSNSIGSTNAKTNRFKIDTSFESAQLETLGVDSITGLVAEANVPAEFAAQAAADVGTLLFKAASVFRRSLISSCNLL